MEEEEAALAAAAAEEVSGPDVGGGNGGSGERAKGDRDTHGVAISRQFRQSQTRFVLS